MKTICQKEKEEEGTAEGKKEETAVAAEWTSRGTRDNGRSDEIPWQGKGKWGRAAAGSPDVRNLGMIPGDSLETSRYLDSAATIDSSIGRLGVTDTEDP